MVDSTRQRRALPDHGLRVGEDVAVGGHDDGPITRELRMPPSTVRGPLQERGAQAVTALCARRVEQDVGVVRPAPETIPSGLRPPGPTGIRRTRGVPEPLRP